MRTITKVNFDFKSTFEHSPMTSCSQNHFGFLESFFVCQHVENHTGCPHSPLRRDPYVQWKFAVNLNGFLGTNEGHVNTSSRPDISRFIICTRGPDRSRGYERHMGWREWETQDGVYKKRRECERNGQWREKTEATPESTVPLPHCTGMLAGGNSIHVTLFSPLSSGDWSPETRWDRTRPVRQKKPTNSQGNQTEVSN